MNVSGKEPEESEERARGWESLSEWTGGAPPESIDALGGARELESVYPLLHGIVGRSPREFLVRAAALEALITEGCDRRSGTKGGTISVSGGTCLPHFQREFLVAENNK